ncbi:MAG: ABC transporter ATP-binding protein [Lewinellaceae bacterium]|nr:ABC transporter ATP-binding protein [Phaeodactylibacter sp.]MCB9349388.1 ABC transporter ATP-binding protein [Lewinellaceae bacterium]
MSKDKILEVKGLQTSFFTDEGEVKAVDGVSFTIHRGETVGIVGESGSGKSVTSLSIMRLVPGPGGQIVGGQVLYYPESQSPGVDLLKVPRRQMQHYRGNEISMIFQEPMSSLNPVFRCGEQVAEAIRLHQKVEAGIAREKVMALFEKVQLPEPGRMYEAYPHQLSGGQKQRVMIAMALSCSPGILIADEPTTALDVTVQKAILDLMNGLKQELQSSIIFITHDLGVIAEIADRVMVMYQGRIVEEGGVLDIFSNPQHPYTKSLLACRPPLGYRLRRLPVVSDFMETVANEEGVLEIREKKASVESVLSAVKVPAHESQQRLEGLKERAPLLKVEQLKVWFPGTRNFWGKAKGFVKAVDGVSFDVFPGETLGLVGESGCGKTTLGRSILGLTRTTEGQILYKGQDIPKLSQDEMKPLRQEMQIIFQDPYSSLNPRLTIGKAIMEPMEVHGLYNGEDERRERALQLLDIVNMEPKFFNRYPHEFSGGQRQRVAIARALALNPQFIICDESVSALDVSVQAQVLNLLMELREKYRFTYIFISHDLSVVKFMSDRMVVMNNGKIEEEGPADEIYANPQREYTKKLIEAIPKGRVEDIELRLSRGFRHSE